MKFKILIVGILAALAGTAQAANLVTNGSFESSAYTVSTEFGAPASQVYGLGTANIQGVTGWTAPLVGGYSHYWIGATASTVAAINRFGGPSASTGERLANSYTGPSPDGGNFIGLDADFIGDFPPEFGPYNSTFEQSIAGLNPGGKYRLDFYWAATQLQSRNGPTTNQMTASLGSETYSTAVLNINDQAFTGWMQQSWIFTASSTTEVLSFLAVGTPAGGPPYALLDGVSLTAVPEPSSWMMLIAGFGFIGLAARRRRHTIVAA